MIVEVSRATVIVDSDGPEPGVRFILEMDDAELAGLLAAYDPTSGTSPSTATARPVLRALLDAALAAGVALPPA